MYIKAVSLRSLRSYTRLDLELGPGINLFFGENAKGKTNLLEAVCYLASLRSFRGARGADMVAWGEKAASISGLVAHGGEGKAAAGGVGVAASRLAVSIADGKRRVTLDGKRPESAVGYLRALKVASFSPEDLFLVKEYPSHRRRFLDRSIFHLYPGYLDLANRYRAALGQLNAALKSRDEGVVSAWEEVLAPLAAEIGFRRRAHAALLGGRAAGLYDGVLGGGGLEVSYRCQVEGPTVEELAGAYRERLSGRRADALKRGHCSVGPHTEDLVVTLSGRDMRASASRGQGRLALMALVLADCELYRDERGHYPTLLLDDVGSELDGKRRLALMECISGMGQALLTATDDSLLAAAGGAGYRVEEGVVRPCGSG